MSLFTAEALAGLTGGITPGTDGPSGAPFKTDTNASKEVHPKQPQYVTVPGKYTETHSTKSDSGMYFHLHDTKGQTFYSVVHPTGTFHEMQSDGSVAQSVTGNMKSSVDGQYTHGSDGNYAQFSNANMEIRVKDTLTIRAKNIKVYVGEDLVEEIGSNRKSTAGAVQTIIGKSKVDINP